MLGEGELSSLSPRIPLEMLCQLILQIVAGHVESLCKEQWFSGALACVIDA